MFQHTASWQADLAGLLPGDKKLLIGSKMEFQIPFCSVLLGEISWEHLDFSKFSLNLHSSFKVVLLLFKNQTE